MKTIYKIQKEDYSFTYHSGIKACDVEKLYQKAYAEGCGDCVEVIGIYDTQEEADKVAKSIKPGIQTSALCHSGYQLNYSTINIEAIALDDDGDEVDLVESYGWYSPDIDELMDAIDPHRNDDDEDDD